MKRVGEPAAITRATDRATNELNGTRADVDTLVRGAHGVLAHYHPDAALPFELSKVRALLDAHMFGRDKRAQRDDAVEIARQIDGYRASQAR